MNLQKPRPRLLDKRETAAAKLTAWRKVREAVLRRDRHKCRACQKGGPLDAHHILRRSLGGKDELNNLVALCRNCHTEVHGHVLIVRWKQDSNRAKTVVFERPYQSVAVGR